MRTFAVKVGTTAHRLLELSGAGDGTRTRNLRITNPLLYQLSYASLRGTVHPLLSPAKDLPPAHTYPGGVRDHTTVKRKRKSPVQRPGRRGRPEASAHGAASGLGSRKRAKGKGKRKGQREKGKGKTKT